MTKWMMAAVLVAGGWGTAPGSPLGAEGAPKNSPVVDGASLQGGSGPLPSPPDCDGCGGNSPIVDGASLRR